MLDHYIWGEVELDFPGSTGAGSTHKMRRSEQPGGAGNAAMNIAGLGAKGDFVADSAVREDGERYSPSSSRCTRLE